MTRAMASSTPFSRTAILAITFLVIASLSVVVWLTVKSEDLEGDVSYGTDGYSASAIGHRGLIDLLGRLDIPVIVSQGDSAERAKKGLLVIAEPAISTDEDRERLRAMVRAAPRVLIVLPKWIGYQSSVHEEWVSSVDLASMQDVAAVLDALDVDARVIRHDKPIGTIPLPHGGPVIPHTPQFLEGDGLSYQINAELPDERIARIAGGRQIREEEPDHGDGEPVVRAAAELTIVADPDILNNHGLGRGANAKLVVGLIERLRDGGPVVFDEVWHGFEREPSLWSQLFRYPLVLASISALLCVLVLVLATVNRFGPPPAQGVAIAPGKDFLIRNTAALLRYGGHDVDALQRYWLVTQYNVRLALHAPRDLPPAAQKAWLDRIAASRGIKYSVGELENLVNEAIIDRSRKKKIPEVATRIHRWRVEMTRHGSGHD
jgi:hypothetical protein